MHVAARARRGVFTLMATALVAACAAAEPAGQSAGAGQTSASETLSAAVAAGTVTVAVRGNGASSGDAIEVTVTRTPKAGPGDLVLTVPAGTRLVSANASAQNMVIGRVRGRMLGGDRFTPSTEIRLTGNTPVTYLLEAFCADFEKDNPSEQVTFTLGPEDSVLACIVAQSSSRSVEAIQAAVWIHTGNVSHHTVNEKFPVSDGDWATAVSMVDGCRKSVKESF